MAAKILATAGRKIAANSRKSRPNNQIMTKLTEEILVLENQYKKMEKVFPNWITDRKITRQEASHQLSCIKSIIKRLKDLKEKEGRQGHLL